MAAASLTVRKSLSVPHLMLYDLKWRTDARKVRQGHYAIRDGQRCVLHLLHNGMVTLLPVGITSNFIVFLFFTGQRDGRTYGRNDGWTYG